MMQKRWNSTEARRLYHEAIYAAEYYRWLAFKGFPLVGHCPYSGQPKSVYQHLHRGEGIVAHKAIARFWLARAKEMRLTGRNHSEAI